VKIKREWTSRDRARATSVIVFVGLPQDCESREASVGHFGGSGLNGYGFSATTLPFFQM
jgi:hypothetical protein